MAERTIVILGGALAGPTAAARARELDEHARIVLVERNTHVSYATTALPLRLSREIASDAELDREGPEHFARTYAIDVRTRTAARALDVRARTVELDGQSGRETLRYDALVYALGVETRRLEVEALERATNARPLRTMADLEAVQQQLASGGRRFAVIGAGTLGLEAVDGLVRAGAEVALVESGARPLPRFGAGVRALLERVLAPRVSLHVATSVIDARVEDRRVRSLTLSSGAVLDVDFVVMAPGVVPRTELLRAAGVPLRQDGSVAIDAAASSGIAGLYACGTCAAVEVVGGGHVWWPQAAIADKTAQVAGTNAAGGRASLSPFTGSTVTRVLSLTVARTGATEEEAVAALGAERIGHTVVHASARHVALRDSAPLFVEAIWDRSTGALLGLEAAGEGAERRVDAAAVAIAGGLSVEELALLDLCYAPAFGDARDPLNVVATIAAAERAGLGRTTHEIGARTLLDVGGGALANALCVPLESLRDRIGELDPKAPLLVVDETGRRSWLAQRILAQRGFDDVVVLAGGSRHAALAAPHEGES